MSVQKTTVDPVKAALHDLVVTCAYADQWLRQTDAFDRACVALGYEYRPGRGLFDTATGDMVDPLEEV